MIQFKTKERKNPKTGAKKYYAASVTPLPIGIDRIAQDIVDETSLSETEVKGVLNALQRHMIKHLQEGKSIKLGDVGSFRTSISSEGMLREEEVTADKIKHVRVLFTSAPRLRKAMSVKAGALQFSKVKAEKPTPRVEA